MTTEQIELSFANYRKDGPETSREAAVGVERSGRAGSYRALLLRAVEVNPGRTCGELAVLVCLPRQEASKRLPELRTAGLIRNGPPRPCREQGTLQLTWFLVQDFPGEE